MTRRRDTGDQESWAKAQIKGTISARWQLRLSDRGYVTPNITVHRATRDGGLRPTYLPVTFGDDAAKEIVADYSDGDAVVIEAEIGMRKVGDGWAPAIYGKSIKKLQVSDQPPEDYDDQPADAINF